MNLTAAALFLLLLATALAVAADAEDAISPEKPAIGSTAIPFYTGNLSVSYFMGYWGTAGPEPSDGATPERVAELKRAACFADCDYVAWCRTEPEPDQWDFSFYKKNADVVHKHGLKYSVFCWLHFPPKWYDGHENFVPYRCLEHDKEVKMTSLWAPGTLEIYRRFYSRLKQEMGPDIDFIRLSLPADYGELGYPAAMTSWLVPQEHAHPGYWCGDAYARQSFREYARKKFGRIPKLNAAWGTSFSNWEELTFPDIIDEAAAKQARESGKPADRRRWLDFIDWYYVSWLDFTQKATGIVRSEFPDNEIILSLGYGSEMTMYGNDYSAAPKLAARLKLSVQTPGNVSYYNLKRISTASHFYGCRYYTEPPGDVGRNPQVARIFNDTSNGVQVFFDYPQNLLGAVDLFQKYQDHMRGHRPFVDFSVFHPTTDFRLHGSSHNFPPRAFEFGVKLRDYADYDVVDEQMCIDGALGKYRALAWVEGNVVDAAAISAVARWVSKGGILITYNLGTVESLDGDAAVWQALMPENLSPLEQVLKDGELDWKAVAEKCMRKVGKGRVIALPAGWDRIDMIVQLAAKVIHDASHLDPSLRNAPRIDGVADHIQATLLPDRILYLNPTDAEIEKRVSLRASDFTGDRPFGKPRKLDHVLKLAPHSIEAIPLNPRR